MDVFELGEEIPLPDKIEPGKKPRTRLHYKSLYVEAMKRINALEHILHKDYREALSRLESVTQQYKWKVAQMEALTIRHDSLMRELTRKKHQYLKLKL